MVAAIHIRVSLKEKESAGFQQDSGGQDVAVRSLIENSTQGPYAASNAVLAV